VPAEGLARNHNAGDGNSEDIVVSSAWRSAYDATRSAATAERANVSDANEIWGANWGANAGRRQATPGDSQPWLVQLAGPSGHTQQRAATWRMRLKAEGRRFDPAPDHQIFTALTWGIVPVGSRS
jgi:hypothetical protein